MKVFLSGGSKSGKSALAEQTAIALSGTGKRYYIATMIPHDAEDAARIRRHVERRAGGDFITLEQGRGVLACLERAEPAATFLLDSVTALLSNEMFLPDGAVDFDAPERLVRELCSLADRVENIVFVSDFIFADAGLYDSYTEAFRRGLARCDRALASVCDTVAEVSAGFPVLYKGVLPV